MIVTNPHECMGKLGMVITTYMPASMMYEGYGHVHHQKLRSLGMVISNP